MSETWVIGDVHGCAQELNLLLARIDREGPARVVLVGDLYTKGPDPGGVWRLIRDRGLDAVLGNHDERLRQHLGGERPRDDHARDVVRALDRSGRGWRKHLAALPLHLEVDGWTVVHASLDLSGKLKRTTKRHSIYRRRAPRDEAPCPFWWSVYEGKRRVVFGHDAARGLVQVHRAGRLQLAGLDTGCVYGGRLTAMRLSDGHLLQVQAARAYQKVG